MSNPTHWCPFSDRVSPLSPDPQPTTTKKCTTFPLKADLTNTNTQNTNTNQCQGAIWALHHQVEQEALKLSLTDLP